MKFDYLLKVISNAKKTPIANYQYRFKIFWFFKWPYYEDFL